MKIAIISKQLNRTPYPNCIFSLLYNSGEAEQNGGKTYTMIMPLISSVAPPGGGGSFPLWVDVQKLCNMCVLSLSWNFFVTHDKYIARPSSKEPR